LCGKMHDGKYASGRFCSKNCSKSFVGLTMKGKKRPHEGRPHTEESKKKMSLSQIEYNEKKLDSIDFSKASKSTRKRILLKEQGNNCDICKNPFIWNGLPLTVVEDHIDGDRKNNSRDNMRAVCPNCHSQTPTFCSRNVSKEGRQRMSENGKRVSTGGRHNHKYYKTVRVDPLPEQNDVQS